MATPSVLDLFVLTFNCAKSFIDPDIFASHLKEAFKQNDSAPGALPDLVVFALQEFAPLSYGFIGNYFLDPYYKRFEDALKLATSPITSKSPKEPSKTPSSKQKQSPYKLVKAKNVGMTSIMLFARDDKAITNTSVADCAFGFKDMSNKGAVGIRVKYKDPATGDRTDGAAGGSEKRGTELTFVATHLAAMEFNLRRRNANWASIMSSLLWANPKDLVPERHHISEPGHKNTVVPKSKIADIPEPSNDERKAMLEREHNVKAMMPEHVESLQNISVFRPGSHLFVAGDLNYRIDTQTPETGAMFPSLDPSSPNFYPNFLSRDQLRDEMAKGNTLHGMTEADVGFPPTYKLSHIDNPDGINKAVNKAELLEAAEDKAIIPWKWSSHRWPGWCDRILYLDLPGWVKRRLNGKVEISVKAYDAMPVMRSSDHRPVFLRVSVPMLTPSEMIVTETDTLTDEDQKDPRLNLPIPIDIGAWERRDLARQREHFAGWQMLLWSSKEGAMIIGTTVLLGMVTWWLYQGY